MSEFIKGKRNIPQNIWNLTRGIRLLYIRALEEKSVQASSGEDMRERSKRRREGSSGPLRFQQAAKKKKTSTKKDELAKIAGKVDSFSTTTSKTAIAEEIDTR